MVDGTGTVVGLGMIAGSSDLMADDPGMVSGHRHGGWPEQGCLQRVD